MNSIPIQDAKFKASKHCPPTTPALIRAHEPYLRAAGLIGPGADIADIIRRLVPRSQQHVADEGHGHDQR